MKQIMILSVALLLLTSCGSVLPKGDPAPRLYTLNAAAIKRAEAVPVLPVSLKIIRPQIAPGLDTERIALRRDHNQIDYYAGVKWASDASAMIQSVLVENFENTHRLKSVSNDLVTLKSDYTVLTDIRDFQVDYKKSNQPKAHIRMTVTLVNTQSDEIVRTFTYDQSEAIGDETMQAIAQGFDKAQQAIMQKLVADVLAHLKH